MVDSYELSKYEELIYKPGYVKITTPKTFFMNKRNKYPMSIILEFLTVAERIVSRKVSSLAKTILYNYSVDGYKDQLLKLISHIKERYYLIEETNIVSYLLTINFNSAINETINLIKSEINMELKEVDLILKEFLYSIVVRRSVFLKENVNLNLNLKYNDYYFLQIISYYISKISSNNISSIDIELIDEEPKKFNNFNLIDNPDQIYKFYKGLDKIFEAMQKNPFTNSIKLKGINFSNVNVFELISQDQFSLKLTPSTSKLSNKSQASKHKNKFDAISISEAYNKIEDNNEDEVEINDYFYLLDSKNVETEKLKYCYMYIYERKCVSIENEFTFYKEVMFNLSKFSNLTTLSLISCQLNDLPSIEKLYFLETLDLSSNSFTSQMFENFFEKLSKLRKLKNLILCDTNINSYCMKPLTDYLKNWKSKSLENLNLSNNQLFDHISLELLSEALIVNKTLSKLNLSKIMVSKYKQFVKIFFSKLESYHFKELEFRYNEVNVDISKLINQAKDLGISVFF